MAEYINRDTFLEHERAWYCKDCNRRKNSKGKTVYEIGEAPCRACDIGDVLDALEDYPAADVVERKTGKWIGGKCNQCGGHAPFWSMSSTYYCSNCCPNCGAKMIGGEDDGA